MKILFLLPIISLSLLFVECKPPNIIFILADDLGYGDVGTYWNNNTYGRIKTPNLNKMASEGTRWTNFYAGDTVCAPSRCSLMTGKHSGHSRIRGNSPEVPLAPEDVTIPMVLKQANYTNQMVGKWGLGGNGSTGEPLKKGFDNYFGYLSQEQAHNYYPDYLWNNTDKYEIPENNGPTYSVYSDDLFHNLSIQWLTNTVNSKNYEMNPFFFYIAYTIPHAGGIGTNDETGEPVPSPEPYANQPWPKVEIDFAAMITRMDGYIGEVFSTLKQLGIDNDTIVLFASDNGAHNEGGHSYLFFDSSGPLRGFKRSMYDGGIRAPLIARWPGHIPQGRVDDVSMFAFWDILPTLADIAGIPEKGLPADIDGTSKLPTLLGQQQPQPDYLYWEFCCNSKFTTAVRSGQWKGVRWSLEGPIELYNVTEDIGEQNNIASHHPQVVKEITQIMKEAHTESKDYPSNPCNAGC